MDQKRPLFYGRRKGRKLSHAKATLLTQSTGNVQITLPSDVTEGTLDPRTFFDGEGTSPLWLEIGFGDGGHMLHQLNKNPTIRILGCEPYENGVARFLSACPPALYPRLRLLKEDIRLLLPLLQGSCFEKIFILFPDPWHKKRHHKRRLINADFLQECARLLIPGGSFIFASDDAPYVEAVWESLTQQKELTYVSGVTSPEPENWPEWPSDWPLTKYAAKAQNQGKALAHLVWEKCYKELK